MKEKNIIKLIDEIKNKPELDLSLGEDLSIALMNIVSLEEHLLFSFMKTQNEKFLKWLEQTRELRKKLLMKVVKKDDDSEKWCMSKHLLATAMRLSEVGTKYLHSGNRKDAEDIFNDAFEAYSMFLAVNGITSNKKEEIHESKLSKISQAMKKLIDCCKE